MEGIGMNAGISGTREAVLVTGVAGFIGFHVAQRLIERGETVIGIDNLNDYYDVRLKEARLAQCSPEPRFHFCKLDVADRAAVQTLFARYPIRRVVHLAAQAGVRYSLVNPHAYTESNIAGFLNVLEGCRHAQVEHLVYASSSSVYGGSTRLPYTVHDRVDHPISLYAATKKANELMAHCYAHLYQIPCTGLRFFTVYGPWGRPDMAIFLFTKAILAGQVNQVFNYGRIQRDFTYIDDIVEGVVRTLDRPATAVALEAGEHTISEASQAPYRLYNIGRHEPVPILRVIEILEQALGTKAKIQLLPPQPGDVPATYAEVADLQSDMGFTPTTSIDVGIRRFVQWYRAFYHV